MITDERIEEANHSVRHYIADGLLRVKDATVRKFVGFLMDNAVSSLEAAALLYKISDDKVSSQILVSKADLGRCAALWRNVEISRASSSCWNDVD